MVKEKKWLVEIDKKIDEFQAVSVKLQLFHARQYKKEKKKSWYLFKISLKRFYCGYLGILTIIYI